MKRIIIMAFIALLLFSCKESTSRIKGGVIIPDSVLVKEVVNPPENFKPKAKVESVEDKSIPTIPRFICILIFKKQPTEEELEKEIRYWIWQVWKGHQNALAINIKCFLNKEKWAFRVADFAPNGQWTNIKYDAKYNEFKVVIY